MSYFTGRVSRGTVIAAVVLLVLGVVAAHPFLSHARPDGVSVLITNNSTYGIRSVFFSPVENDNWGDNQLIRVVTPGLDVTVTENNCPGPQVKIIAEDTDGCFLTTIVTCGGNAAWTITDNSGRDCGN